MEDTAGERYEELEQGVHGCPPDEHGHGPCCGKTAKTWAVALTLGMVLGAILALMLAPRRGSEMRQRQREKAEALLAKLKDVVKQMEESI